MAITADSGSIETFFLLKRIYYGNAVFTSHRSIYFFNKFAKILLKLHEKYTIIVTRFDLIIPYDTEPEVNLI